MTAKDQKQWVVLLNKVPKGPLSEEEVKTLLNQGILRLNDVAYRVMAESQPEAGRPEWKLLWQYDEFNRRKVEKAVPDVPTGEFERRKKVPPEEIRRQALTDLPPDLMEIAPEDLLPRSTSVSLTPEPHSFDKISSPDEPKDYKEGFTGSQRSELRWGFALIVLVALGFGALKIVSRTIVPQAATNTPAATPTPTSAADPKTASADRLPAAQSRKHLQLPTKRPGESFPTPPKAREPEPSPPSREPDEGEVQEERGTDVENRDDRDNQNQDERGDERRGRIARPNEAGAPRRTTRRPTSDNPDEPDEAAPASEDDARPPVEDDGGQAEAEESY